MEVTNASQPRVRNLFRCRAVGWLLAVLLHAAAALSAAAGPLQAGNAWQVGVARTKITPQQPVWMAGYASRTKPAEGTLNDLWAKALVLQDPAGQRVVLVSLDLCGIDRETSVRICQRLEREHRLPRASVALTVSHTHSGPVVGHNLRPTYGLSAEESEKIRTYTAWLEDRVVETVGKAGANLAPATLRYGVGAARFAVNRRENKEAEVTQRAAGDPGGSAPWRAGLKPPFDHDLPVLSVYSTVGAAQDQPIAILFGYACHATTLSGYEWSGDWPGFAAESIEADYPGATAMFVAGCGADQNPFPRREVAFARDFGKQIADGIRGALAVAKVLPAGPIRSKYQEIDLPFGQLPARDVLERQKASTDPKDRYLARRAALLLERMARDGKLATTYPYPVQSWQLGPGPTLVFLGGEVVVDYAIRIKEAHGGSSAVWPVAYANDVMAYIPSLRVLREGGYEGASAMVYYGQPASWGEAVEEAILAEVQRQMTASPASRPATQP